MGHLSTASILFVDDDPCMCEIMSLMLGEEGYEVRTAGDGLEALVRMREYVPDLIISDLHMPRMSGVEFLSVVRRRFPAIPVIAISGAYGLNESNASGVMADAFYPKGACHPDALFETIRKLVYGPLSRPTNYHPCQPPRVQVARNSVDAGGKPSLQLTCTDCLRAFYVASVSSSGEYDLRARCSSCGAQVCFTCDEVQTTPMLGRIMGTAPGELQVG